MKLKDALKKFNFLKKLNVPDQTMAQAANHLARTLQGSTEVFLTPLAKNNDPFFVLADWEEIYEKKMHLLNQPLLDLERSNRAKFGPRSIAVPWSERLGSIKASYNNQDPNHVAKAKYTPGPGYLMPVSIADAVEGLKLGSSSGLPYLTKKAKCLEKLLDEFDDVHARQDPCMIYTRTAENSKTRNVWGYPFAVTLFESLFYIPLLNFQKNLFYRAALVSPDLVAERFTEIIDDAIKHGKMLYSLDIKAFDSSVKYQYIIFAFDYIKSCFSSTFDSSLSYVCEKMYSIEILTPTGIYRGNHGIPSGSTFTNEVDSIIQVGVALTCSFIDAFKCMVQGDDGVYSMFAEQIQEFEKAFEYAGLSIEKSKSIIAADFCLFCQMLYHTDYRVNGIIHGIYPTYRAINRLLYQERFVDFKRLGIEGKDYYGIRCLTILENCKYHPLFEELVTFVYERERFSLDISDGGLEAYFKFMNTTSAKNSPLNQQYGSSVGGIRKFSSYKLIAKLRAAEEDSRLLEFVRNYCKDFL